MDINLLVANGVKRLLNPQALRNCYLDGASRIGSKSELNTVRRDKIPT